MLDINGGELLVLGAVGVIVLGPERLPQYAAQLGKFVRQARSFARNAKAQMREELGEDFEDIDWQSLDPRRYDPRRIVRDALLDDDAEQPQPRRASSRGGASVNLSKAAGAAGVAGAAGAARSAGGDGVADVPPSTTTSGFDPDAT